MADSGVCSEGVAHSRPIMGLFRTVWPVSCHLAECKLTECYLVEHKLADIAEHMIGEMTFGECT